MADDKKNIPDAGKVDEPPKPGKVEPIKADSTVQDQPAPAKAEAPVIEDATKVVKPLTAEQPAPAGKEAPKEKDAPAKEGVPQPGKDEKQTTIPDKAKPQPRDKMSQSKPPAGKGAPVKAEAPTATEQPPAPRDGTMRKCRGWWSRSRPPESISLRWCGPVRAADMRL